MLMTTRRVAAFVGDLVGLPGLDQQEAGFRPTRRSRTVARPVPNAT